MNNRARAIQFGKVYVTNMQILCHGYEVYVLAIFFEIMHLFCYQLLFSIKDNTYTNCIQFLDIEMV